jgi:hypothetical protein
VFTEVPIAAHGLGFILDDTTAEFDPNSPQFGEKFAPPFLPITIRDWTGRVIGKTLSDQYGRYNFIAASTATANLPQPSGMGPAMLTTCMNDPGDDPNLADPNWNQQYSTFCYNFQYMPGTTTYLDTPVLPVAAFTGPAQFPLDCEYPDGTRGSTRRASGPTASAASPTSRDRPATERRSETRRSPSPRWVTSRSRTPTTVIRRPACARPARTRSSRTSPATTASGPLVER